MFIVFWIIRYNDIEESPFKVNAMVHTSPSSVLDLRSHFREVQFLHVSPLRDTYEIEILSGDFWEPMMLRIAKIVILGNAWVGYRTSYHVNSALDTQ